MTRLARPRQLLVCLLTLLAALAPSAASAHPLGNFTVNHYSRIEPGADQVRIVYVLDMAEIPTFQEQPRLQADPSAYADARAEELRQNLHLSLDGQPATLRLEQRTLSTPPGQGGLPTLRLEAVYAADIAGTQAGPASVNVTYRDDNDPSRIGWREIVGRSTPGASIESSSVAAADVTDELRHYPEDLLNSPLDVRAAHLTFAPTLSAASLSGVPASTSVPVLERSRSALADLASGTELTPSFILFALGVATVLGMAHALQPGHGKTVVAAYLVGSRGTARHALFLGATVTATHTAGVYALGFVTLFLSRFILPERLYPILEIVSGLLVVGIGLYLFGNRLLAALRARLAPHVHQHVHDHDDHHHDEHERQHHEHQHGSGKAHTHVPPNGRITWRSLLALGVSGGLLPCPEALMVLLITIAAHRVLFGLLLIVAFSTGLASVLIGFGLLLVFARGLFQRVNLTSGLAPRVLPVASAAVIVVAGAVITAQALPQVL
jgi:nickel/cobalt transporter (NicO) family protein